MPGIKPGASRPVATLLIVDRYTRSSRPMAPSLDTGSSDMRYVGWHLDTRTLSRMAHDAPRIRDEEIFEVRLMARAEDYAMVRRKGMAP